jgi:hypothetical protein
MLVRFFCLSSERIKFDNDNRYHLEWENIVHFTVIFAKGVFVQYVDRDENDYC